MQNVFDTYKRAVNVYIQAQTVTISTSPTFSRFGQADQNVFNPPVTPQVTQIYAVIRYKDEQDFSFIEPASRTNYSQEKLRNSFGEVRLKVDAIGYTLMSQCKLAVLDGFNFTLTSTPRPHSVIGDPMIYTFLLTKTD